MVGGRVNHDRNNARVRVAETRRAEAARRAAGRGAPYPLRSNRPGVCDDCGRRFPAGESIRWWPARKIAVHDGCEMPGEGKRYREAE